MTASLNAVASSSHIATSRDARELNAGSSVGNGESFSQVLRRTSGDQKPGDQKSSGPNRSREADKREVKSAKKDDDGNPTAAVPANSNAVLVEKSALPITFLFGLPSPQQLQSFEGQATASDSSSSSSSQMGGKVESSNRSVPAYSGVLPGRMPDEDSDPVQLMAGTSSFTLPDNVDAQKVHNSSATINGPELSIGSSGNSIRGAAGALSTNTLAFAMRLGSGESANASKPEANSAAVASYPASNNSQPNSGMAMPNIIQAAPGSDLGENAHEHEPSAQEHPILDVSATPPPEHFDASKIAQENVTAPAVQAPADLPAAPAPEPVRNVHMQLVSDDNRRVDVRLIDRGGELHVSVKSADPALTQNLQDHLPDLTARLDKQHMQTEVWVPKAAEPAKADAGSTNGSPADSNARSYSGNSEGRKDGRQQGKPDWVDALEKYT